LWYPVVCGWFCQLAEPEVVRKLLVRSSFGGGVSIYRRLTGRQLQTDHSGTPCGFINPLCPISFCMFYYLLTPVEDRILYQVGLVGGGRWRGSQSTAFKIHQRFNREIQATTRKTANKRGGRQGESARRVPPSPSFLGGISMVGFTASHNFPYIIYFPIFYQILLYIHKFGLLFQIPSNPFKLFLSSPHFRFISFHFLLLFPRVWPLLPC